MASAAFNVNGVLHSTSAHSVSYSATVNLALVSTLGVNTITWSIAGTSLPGMASPTITPAGSPSGATASFSFMATPGDDVGRALTVKCKVIDNARNELIAYAVIGVVGAAGNVPFVAGEVDYRSSTHGVGGDMNAAIAAAATAGGGAAGAETVKSAVRLATAAALPSHNFAANVMTAVANGALTVDGVAVVAGDRVLVKNENPTGGHLQNGIYSVTQIGSAGTPWILTRATDWDASSEFETGTTVTATAGSQMFQTFMLTTTGSIVLNTTALTFVNVSTSGVINVVWFGAFDDPNYEASGATGTDQLAFFQAAATAALSLSKPLYVPAGRYLWKIGANFSSLFWSSGTLTMFGDGADKTFIKCGPDDPTVRGSGGSSSGTGISVGADATLIISDLWLKGPGDVDLLANVTLGILHGDGTGKVVCRNIKTDKWSYAIKCSACDLEVFDCDIQSSLTCILHGEASSANPNRGLLRDSKFTTDPDSVTNPTGAEHCYYFRRGVTADIINCEFVSCPDTAVHCWGGSGATATHLRVTGCTFQDQVVRHIICNPDAPNLVSDCIFIGGINAASAGNETGIQLQGPAGGTFTGLTFIGTHGNCVVPKGAPCTGRFSFVNCVFACAFKDFNGSFYFQSSADSATANVSFTRCRFKSSTHTTYELHNQTNAELTVDQCNFETTTCTISATVTFAEVGGTGDTITANDGTNFANLGVTSSTAITVTGSVSNNVTGTPASVSGGVITMNATDLANEGPVAVTITFEHRNTNIASLGGRLIMRRNRFHHNRAELYCKAQNAASTVELYDNEWQATLTGGENLMLFEQGANAGTLRQRGNKYPTSTLWSGNFNNGSGTNWTAETEFTPGTGPDVASSATISISHGYDFYTVTGTTQVNTIHVSGNNDADAFADAMTTGTVRFRAASALLAFGTSGNIVTRGNMIRVLQANEVISFRYSPAAAKWLEVGGEVLASSGAAPAEAEGAGAGTGASTTITGGALNFKVALTTGTTAAAGLLSTLTLSRAVPGLIGAGVYPLNSAAETLGARAIATSTTVLELRTVGTPVDATLYEWLVVVTP